MKSSRDPPKKQNDSHGAVTPRLKTTVLGSYFTARSLDTPL